MSQLTFAEAEYATKNRKTRRELFLEKLEILLPWKQLTAPISKHYVSGRCCVNCAKTNVPWFINPLPEVSLRSVTEPVIVVQIETRENYHLVITTQ